MTITIVQDIAITPKIKTRAVTTTITLSWAANWILGESQEGKLGTTKTTIITPEIAITPKTITRAVTIACKKHLSESEEDKLGTACTKAVQMYLVLELLILLKCLFKSRRGSLELTWILCPRKLTLQQVADKPEKRPSDTISYSVESQA